MKSKAGGGLRCASLATDEARAARLRRFAQRLLSRAQIARVAWWGALAVAVG
jgi:hypothetical protein